MNNIKKSLAKLPLIIDLRPIQNFKHNGVTIASTNWITELIRQSKNDEPIILWTNSHSQTTQLPKHWLTKKNIQHIHTKIPNFLINITWSFKIGKSINKILKLPSKQNYFYICSDIRAFKTDKYCLNSLIYFHDVAFLKFPESLSLKSKIWFKLIQPKKIFKTANTILTNSKFSKTEILKSLQSNQSQKIHIIHPSIPKKLYINPNFQPPVSEYYLVISTLQSRKNLQQLIQKFQEPNLKKQNLVILGNTEKMFSKYQIPSYPNIFLLENLSQENKHSLIQQSKAVIYPSKYEGFGLPILESIRLKKNIFTPLIKPYTQLFKNHIEDINDLYKNQTLKNKNLKKNIYPLKKEVRKLKKLIYDNKSIDKKQ